MFTSLRFINKIDAFAEEEQEPEANCCPVILFLTV